MRPTATAIVERLERADLLRWVKGGLELGDCCVYGWFELRAVVQLRKDKRFTEGGLHHLHKDVGLNRTEFRSDTGKLLSGSTQIVVDLTTGRFYADVDRFNPYQDAANNVGHALLEVLPGWMKPKSKGEQT